jgi:hypothetical protein
MQSTCDPGQNTRATAEIRNREPTARALAEAREWFEQAGYFVAALRTSSPVLSPTRSPPKRMTDAGMAAWSDQCTGYLA